MLELQKRFEKKIVFDEYGKAYEIPVPEGWTIDITLLGVQAWAHSPDKEIGVAAIQHSTRSALEELKKRMEDWIEFDKSHA